MTRERFIVSYQRPLNSTLRSRCPVMPTQVGIHVFLWCKQRHGWRAFAHHDVGRPVRWVNLIGRWYQTRTAEGQRGNRTSTLVGLGALGRRDGTADRALETTDF
jgi:hypothetical protein